jgi:glycerol-3-phosphate acyltransferase PlsY
VRSVTAVGLVSGPLILLGYAVGSLPVAYLLARRRLRSQLRGAPIRADGQTNDGAVVAATHAALALAVATLAWHVTVRVAPGGNYRVPEASRIAFASTQVLTAWQSVALWTGLAAVVGHVAPVWGRFRSGGSGLVPALALLLAYAPSLFTASVLAFFAGLVLTRSPRPAVAVALAMTVGAAWAAWLTEVPSGWGVVNGPEVTLWAAVLGGVLFARWQRGDVPAPPGGPSGPSGPARPGPRQ